MKTKRITALLMALTLTVSISACGESESKTAQESTENSSGAVTGDSDELADEDKTSNNEPSSEESSNEEPSGGESSNAEPSSEASMETAGSQYKDGQTYYDAGTFTLDSDPDGTAWNISNAVSTVAAGEEAITLGNTTNVNTSTQDPIKGLGLDAANKNTADYQAPLPSNETYQYVAKGTVTVGTGTDVDISWEIHSWPADNGGTLPTEATGAEAWFSGKEWENHAPVWASGNEDYFKWSADGDYTKYNADTGRSEFKYGSSFLVWDGGGGKGGTAWSVIYTYPYQWGIDAAAWDMPENHIAVDAGNKGGVIAEIIESSISDSYKSSVNETHFASGKADICGFDAKMTLYTGGVTNFLSYLNDTRKVNNNMSSWSIPAFDTAVILDYMYGNPVTGVMKHLKELKNGTIVTKGTPGDSSGYAAQNITLNLDDDGALGVRIYGGQSAVYAIPGDIWDGLGENGTGSYAYKSDEICESPGYSSGDNPWDSGKNRYPGIQCTGGYLPIDSSVHAYYDDSHASEFVWAISDVPAEAQINGVNSFDSVRDRFMRTRLYTAYDDRGYRTSNTLLDAGEPYMVNSHVSMDILSIVFFDITDDSQRAVGTVIGSLVPGQESAAAASGRDSGQATDMAYTTSDGKAGTYTGGWQDDKPNGHGTIVFENGDVLEGEWKDGKANGQGRRTYANGNVFEGEYKDDKPDGPGVFTWSSGHVFEGEWKDGKRSGHGRLTYADGRVLEVEYKDDKPNGQGTLRDADGNVLQDGMWEDGEFVG